MQLCSNGCQEAWQPRMAGMATCTCTCTCTWPGGARGRAGHPPDQHVHTGGARQDGDVSPPLHTHQPRVLVSCLFALTPPPPLPPRHPPPTPPPHSAPSLAAPAPPPPAVGAPAANLPLQVEALRRERAVPGRGEGGHHQGGGQHTGDTSTPPPSPPLLCQATPGEGLAMQASIQGLEAMGGSYRCTPLPSILGCPHLNTIQSCKLLFGTMMYGYHTDQSTEEGI